MKIRRVQPFLLSYPLPQPVVMQYYGGERTILKRDAMLIRVEADSGLVGYAPGHATELAFQRITEFVAPFLEGRLLAEPDALRVMFQEGPGMDPEILKVYAAVEVALYDLLGKDLGVPVSELIGGRVRDRIKLYGSAGMYQPPESYAAEAAGIAALGFPAYKMRPALGPEEDLRTVKLMREAVGPAVELMVDAHSWWRMGDRSYAPETVERLAGQMAEYEVCWLEEPLPPDDHAAYRKLRATGLIALAAGEHEQSENSFADLILDPCVDYAQMDLVCQGGYITCRRILADVERGGLRFAFHSWGTDLEALAAAHLGICWPDGVAEWLEYPVYSTPRLQTMYPFPLARDILQEPLEIHNGELIVPNKAGLGIEVDEDVIRRYPWIPGPWSFFKLISPAETFAISGDHSVKWASKTSL